ncbi:AMP-binding protein [Phenylobacterium sp.]|jgi:acyl-CoA synthetase (AMP-forming)/AMP-acid ligase II|uniref:AMP-binding protein n=1 Tax=Phenylobacterium sp. TaxID=1871053 RepID=UPI002F42F0C8
MFDAFVAFRARLEPRAIALITPDRRTSFAALDAEVDKVAVALAADGLSTDSGVVAADAPDAHSRAVLLLALARLRVASSPAADPEADLRIVLDADWFARAAAAPSQTIAPRPVDPQAPGRVLLSPQEGGDVRRVGLTWAMIQADLHDAATLWLAGKAGRWAPAIGLDTREGFTTALTAWASGAAVVTGWGPDSLSALLEDADPSVLVLTPDQLRDLLATLLTGARPRPDLRVLACGRTLPWTTAREARLRLAPDLRTLYGTAECIAVAHFDAARLEEADGAVGWPAPDVRLEIVEIDGAALPRGRVGAVRIHCPRAVRSHLSGSGAEATAFRDGGFQPGDMGRLTAQGLLVLEGRVEDRIDLAGRGIMPGPIEAAALGCEGVADAAVFAAPKADGEEQLWLAVMQGPDFRRERLVAALQAVAGDWPTVRFVWVEAIPRDGAGRADRAALRAEVVAAIGAAIGPKGA